VSAARFDWDAVHARLQSQRLAFESSGSGAVSADETERILEGRARRLAAPLEPPRDAELIDILVFFRAGQGYGVEAAHVREALPRTSPTPLPGRRPGLAGVTNHRGRILAVVDLGGLRPRDGGRPEGRIVAVETRGIAFGLLADEITGIVPIAHAEIAAGAPGSEAWVRGTTTSMVCVLDLQALAEDPRIRVEE
jgi:chemotaxis signal transduction protein